MSTDSTLYTLHVYPDGPSYRAVSPDLPLLSATGCTAEEAAHCFQTLALPKAPLYSLFLPSDALLPDPTYNAATLAPH